MAIYLIEGTIGAGKTLAMTCLGFLNYVQGLEDKSLKRKTYANYKLNFPYEHLAGLGEFKDWKKEPCDILLDEGWLDMDSRESMSNLNMLNTTDMMQSRKIESDVYFTCQHTGQIDVRVRNITSAVISPQIVAWDEDGRPSAIYLGINDRPMILGSYMRYGMVVNPVTASIILPLEYEGYGHICDMYDTSEIVDNMEHPRHDYLKELGRKFMGWPGTKKALVAHLTLGEEFDVNAGEAKLIADLACISEEERALLAEYG